MSNSIHNRFRRVARAVAALWILLAATALSAHPRSTEFRNGLWFDGEGFRPGTWYAVDGKLTRERPSRIGARVDLGGRHVVPAYAEAHNHNLQNAWGATQFRQRYVDDGVMYAAMLCGSPTSTRAARAALGADPGVDVLFADACISSSDGHPLRMARQQPDGSMRPSADIHDRDYIVMDTLADIERKWPRIRAAAPDLVKLILVHSEVAERRGDPKYDGVNGLDPRLVPPLVAAAHADGVRVAAHTESAADFAVAVDAGVDIVAHLPGYQFWNGMDESAYRIDDAVIGRALARGVTVIATASAAAPASRGDAERLARVQAVQRDNLMRLIAAGVPIAIGSDRYDATSVAEYGYLAALDVFEPRALLRSMVETTPQLLFPQRQIGRIAEGHEANFLALDGDPLLDPQAIARVGMRVRMGSIR